MPRRTPNLTLAAAVAGCALILPQAATAKQVTFKVTSAAHSSNAAKTELPYQGSSSASWKLAGPNKEANNRFQVSIGNGIVSGIGSVNVKGAFAAQASSDTASCGLTAPTGSDEYGMVAPGPVMLGLNKDPVTGKPAFVFAGQQATLGNPYFESGCRTSIAGEPDAERTALKYVKASLFRKKSFSIKLAGSTMEDGIAYRWSTVFKFKRVR